HAAAPAGAPPGPRLPPPRRRGHSRRARRLAPLGRRRRPRAAARRRPRGRARGRPGRRPAAPGGVVVGGPRPDPAGRAGPPPFAGGRDGLYRASRSLPLIERTPNTFVVGAGPVATAL